MMEAYDANAVVERLHREDFFRVEPAAEQGRLGRRLFGAPRVPARDVLAFTQQLATLVEAGLPLERRSSSSARWPPAGGCARSSRT